MTVNTAYLGENPAERLTLWVPDGSVGWSALVVDRIPVSDDENDTVWEGRVAGDPHSNVSIALAGTDAAVALITTTGGLTLRLRKTGDVNFIDRIGDKILDIQPSYAEPTPSVSCGERTRQITFAKRHCSAAAKAVVRVLVLYTPGAESWAGDQDALLAWIRLAESRTNQSFRQSGIKHRVQFVVGTGVAAHKTPRKLIETLDDLIQARDELMGIPALRASTVSDLVVLIDGPGEGGGVACPLRKTDDSSLVVAPFGVVAIDALSNADVLSHELGHLLGAAHHDETGVNPATSHGFISWALKWKLPWMSLMERDSTCPNCALILYWSNVTEPGPLGWPMGNPYFADNASTLNETMCTVAGEP